MKLKLKFWILLIVGIILIALGTVLMCTVNWLKLFDMPVGLIVLFGGLLSLIYLYLEAVPAREAKVYLNSDGLPDVTTARYYGAKKLKFGQGFFSRGKISIPWNSLQSFYIKGRIVEMTVKSGKRFSSSLEDLMVKYHMEESKASGEMEVSGYSLKNRVTGEKMTIYYPGISFEPDEWRDIAGVLSQASVVKESVVSKAGKIFSKAKGMIEDFDFSDVTGSIAGKVTDGAMDAAAEKIVNFATGINPKKKEGKFKKILKGIVFWTIVVAIILYGVFDVWNQIEVHNMEKIMNIEEGVENAYGDEGWRSSYTEEDADDEEIAVEEVIVDDDYISIDDVEEEVRLVDADESLLDITIDREFVLRGGASLNPLKIGNNYNKIFNETGSTHKSLKATGAISSHNVTVRCWLTEEGEIHGRYHNDNGINLDLNGFIQSDGNLYIQLGHGSEKSEWRLHPVSDEISGTYRYEGTWGKNNKSSYLVFFEE